jgi:hypothetical protein
MSARFIIVKILLVCFLIIRWNMPAFAQKSFDQKSKETRFNAIKEVVVDSTKSISNCGAEEAYDIIVDSLNRFRNLYQKVKDAEYVDEVIDEVTEALKRNFSFL